MLLIGNQLMSTEMRISSSTSYLWRDFYDKRKETRPADIPEQARLARSGNSRFAGHTHQMAKCWAVS
jgi:hypothetical protein